MSNHGDRTASSSIGTRLRRGVTSRRARAIMSIGIVLGIGAVGTMATWTDNASAASGIFKTGTMDLQINDQQGFPTAYGFVALNATGLNPGYSKSAMLPVQNKGTAPFKYTMKAAASTSTLAPYLTVGVYSGGTATNASNVGTCSGALIETVQPLVSGGSANIIATPRLLAASTGVENLCFKVGLSSTTPVSVQNQSVSATFNFNAATG